MSGDLVIGTVRGRKGHSHRVILQDGRQLDIVFDGAEVPQIGADVIGLVATRGGVHRMKLVPDVTRLLLQGRSLIAPAGRPDLTARMLGRLLEGAGPGLIRPGIGGLIERTPRTDDPALTWALSILGPEAQSLGVALNVIDPIAFAKAPWDEARLRDEVLPADAHGDKEALSDLKSAISEGLSPICRRTVEVLGDRLRVPSVDFILPYSPFATGVDFSRGIARAFASEVPFPSLATGDARRISAFREIALAFAPRYLGANPVDGEAREQLEQSFADAAAAIAFLRHGGDVNAVLRLARLREHAIQRWDGKSRPPAATHGALATVLSMGAALPADTGAEILDAASGIARTSAPQTTKALLAQRASARSTPVLVDIASARREIVLELEQRYRDELGSVASALDGDPVALARMARLAPSLVPLGFDDAFNDFVSPLALASVSQDDPDFGAPFEDDYAPAGQL